ncbi:hypothetical protein G6F68_020278 [Rhizopus microsporus]|nr:hypothetical protein G6F68_020278 [Rhizopus microsporus]
MKSNEIDYKTLPALLMMQYQPDLLANKIMNQEEYEEKEGEETVDNRRSSEEAIGNILSEPATQSWLLVPAAE